jgi:hypothetical protein
MNGALVEAVADQHELGARPGVTPDLEVSQLGTHARALDEPAPWIAGEVTNPSRARAACRAPDRREHAIADERCASSQNDRDELV